MLCAIRSKSWKCLQVESEDFLGAKDPPQFDYQFFARARDP
jgi:hypothetical protein